VWLPSGVDIHVVFVALFLEEAFVAGLAIECLLFSRQVLHPLVVVHCFGMAHKSTDVTHARLMGLHVFSSHIRVL